MEALARIEQRLKAATHPHEAVALPLLDIVARTLAIMVLFAGLIAFAHWSGQVVASPGGWWEADKALYGAVNALQVPPLTAFFVTVLNEPAPVYFALILLILSYCWWRQRPLLPAAALAIGVAMTLGLTASREAHHAAGGYRERPYLHVTEAYTPIAACDGVGLVAIRGADGPAATCEPADTPAADAAPAPSAGAAAGPGSEATASAAGDSAAAGETGLVPEASEEVTAASGDALVTATAAAAGTTPSPTLRGLDWRERWQEFASFPSGHMREVVLLCVILVAFWRAAWPYALAFALVMAFSRVYLGAHYPSDVLGGTLLGLWTGGLALLAVDLLRRLLRYLHRVPAVRGGWEWVYYSRTEGRPARDPALARGLRVGSYVLGLHLALLVLGWLITTPGAGQINTVLLSADAWAGGQLQGRFVPGVAAALAVLFGHLSLVYLLLAGATLAFTWQRRRTAVGAAGAEVVGAAALALWLSWLGGQWFPRQPPVLPAEAALPADWLVRWSATASFPDSHALLAAALAGVLAGAWRRAAIPAQIVAAAAALASLYVGAAWLTDALAGFALGNLAAMLARYAVAQAFPLAELGARPTPKVDTEHELARPRGERGAAVGQRQASDVAPASQVSVPGEAAAPVAKTT